MKSVHYNWRLFRTLRSHPLKLNLWSLPVDVVFSQRQDVTEQKSECWFSYNLIQNIIKAMTYNKGKYIKHNKIVTAIVNMIIKLFF